MRIQSIRLHPFAGHADCTVEFQPGLNVISGPNEAGKSTLLNALQAALLTSTKIGKREWEQHMQEYLPLSGGDTIRLSVAFHKQGDFTLVKSWGGSSAAQLKLSGGEVLEDPGKIDSQLSDLLELKQGTWRNVLFAGQSDLTDTLEELEANGEEMGDLAARLRGASFATDGISIEQLGKSLEKRIQEYADHWDESMSRPEQNRGLENPWKQKVGRMLQAWYEREGLRRAVGEVEAYERDMDALAARFHACAKEREELAGYIESHAAAVKDAESRALLEARQEALIESGKALKQVSLEWPKLEERKKNIVEEQKSAVKRLADLEQKLKTAKAYENNQVLRDRVQRAEKKQEECTKIEQELKKETTVSEQQMRQVEEWEQQIKHLETGLAAGKLKLKFSARSDMELGVRRDLEKEQSQSVKKGKEYEWDAGGQIVVQHDDWEMTVQSGESDFTELQKKYDSVCSELDRLLESIGEKDSSKVRVHYESAREKKSQRDGLKNQLKEILEDDTLEELKKKLGEEKGATPPGSSSEIAAEKGKLEGGVESLGKQMSEIEAQMESWRKEYESQEQLLDLLVEKRGELQALKTQIESLKPLPDDVENARQFIAGFRQREEKLKEVTEQWNAVKIDRAKREGEAPQQELKELEEALVDAEAAFEQVQKEWKALLRIQQVYEKLRKEMDRGTFDPWMEKLKQLSESLSGGRYRDVQPGKGVAERAEGEMEIPYGSLSTGTRACLGLAVRLSMARHFLEQQEGFVVLDDPMVDLDPERQKAAVAILQDFARDKQVIVMTCHPAHAEMMGGHLIEL